jgi:hypothetical protein
MIVEFRSLAHAQEAWNAVKTVLSDYTITPALSGRLMETMSDLAIAIDNFEIENRNKFTLVKEDGTALDDKA